MAASFCWRDGGGMGGIPFAVCLTELRGSGNGGRVFPAVQAVWINGKQFNSRSQYGIGGGYVRGWQLRACRMGGSIPDVVRRPWFSGRGDAGAAGDELGAGAGCGTTRSHARPAAGGADAD